MRSSIFYTCLWLTCLTWVLASPHPIFAQAFDLSVVPPTAYLRIQPGSQTTHTITLENRGDSVLHLTPEIVDFSPDGLSGFPQLKTQLSFPYLVIPEGGLGSVTLAPRDSAQLTLLISVPANVEEKEYPMTILFRQSDQNVAGLLVSESLVRGTVATNLIVLISNTDHTQDLLKVSDLGAPRLIDSFQTLKFTPLLQNNYLGALVASGSAVVTNWRGQEVAQFTLYPDIVLGKSTRQARALKQETDPELGEIANPIEFQLRSKLGWWGWYTVRLQLIGNADANAASPPTTTVQQTVVALPIFAMLVVSVLGLATWWIWRSKRMQHL